MHAFRIVIAACVGLWSICALAQDAPPGDNANRQGQQGQNANGQNGAPNNPGTPADPNNPAAPAATDPNAPQTMPENAGPEIIDDPNATPEQKASAEYSGPAVLSRGISASEPMNPQNVKFTPSAALEYVYNSGLSGVAIGPSGNIVNGGAASGVQLTYSLVGTKVRKRDVFSLSFTGSLFHYFNDTQYDGSSDALTLTWRHQLTRHLTFGVQVSANQFNQNNLILSGDQYINSGAGTTLVTSTPATEAFDGRVFSFLTQGSLTYQLNARLSFNLSGGGFLTRRESSSLYGDTGYQAGADLAYRLTRQTTIGAYYSYTTFNYIGFFGDTAVNTVGLTYSVALSPHTQIITRLGGSRLDLSELTTTTLSPLLGLLFGTPSVQEAIHQTLYEPDFNAQIRHKSRNLGLSLAYARGITPGNGLILTSTRQTGTGGVDGTVGRLWRLSASTGYDSLSGVGLSQNEKFESIFFSASVYRKIMRNLDWHARLDFHHYLFDDTGYLRNTTIIAFGLAWAPGNVLERVW